MRIVLALLALLWAMPSHAVIVSGGLAAAGSASPVFDNASASSPGTGNLSWSHIPVSDPKGVVCYVVQYNSGADQVTGVTYGGSAMTELTGSPLLKTNAEAMAVYGYFLGSSIPTGEQTVAVTVSGSANKKGYCFSVTAGNDTAIVDTTTISSDSVENPSGTLSLGGVNSFAVVGGVSGHDDAASTTSLTNWTSRTSTDFGTEVVEIHTYDLIQADDIAFGWTAAAEDAVAIGVAVRVSSAADVTDPYVSGFTPPDGQTGVAVGTTSASFQLLDDGAGVDITTLSVSGKGCASCGSCDAGLTCSGTTANYLITRTGLSFGYDNVWSETIDASDLAAAPNAMTQHTYNFTIQSDPGAGGTLLAGDNTYGSDNLNVVPNRMYSSPFTASVSGTAATAWIYYVNTSSTNCKVALYASGDTGAMLDNVIIPVSGTGWKSAALTGAASIVSGTAYRIGVVCNGYNQIGTDTTGTHFFCSTDSSYTTPPNPNCRTSGATVAEGFNIYVTD